VAVAVAVAGTNESPKTISGNHAVRKPASSTRRPYCTARLGGTASTKKSSPFTSTPRA
jgi:hypothetical protein